MQPTYTDKVNGIISIIAGIRKNHPGCPISFKCAYDVLKMKIPSMINNISIDVMTEKIAPGN